MTSVPFCADDSRWSEGVSEGVPWSEVVHDQRLSSHFSVPWAHIVLQWSSKITFRGGELTLSVIHQAYIWYPHSPAFPVRAHSPADYTDQSHTDTHWKSSGFLLLLVSSNHFWSNRAEDSMWRSRSYNTDPCG